MKRCSLGLGILLTAVFCLQADDPLAKVPTIKPPKGEKPPSMEDLLARNKELVPALIAGLKDGDSEVRVTSAYILVNIGKSAVGPLTETLKNKDRDMRANAAYVLSQFGRIAEEAIPELTAALKDEDAEVRRRSAYAISRIMEDLFVPLPQSAPPPPPPAPPPGPDGPAQAGWTSPRSLNPSLLRPKSSINCITDPGLLPPERRPVGS